MSKTYNILSKGIARINWSIDLFRVNKRTKLEDTILILGTPRGGTTWLMELLETLPEYRSIFEPLNKDWFPQIRQIGLGYRSYIPIQEKQLEAKEYLQRIFTGRINSLNSEFLPNPGSIPRSLFAKKLIVKFIRANRMLPWIANNFQVGNIFLVIRHPCATIASQIESGIRGYYLPKTSQISKEMVIKEVLKISFVRDNEGLMRKIKGLKAQEEILAAVWSLDNYIPLIHPKPYPWHMVIYEKLLTEGEKEIKYIFDTIGAELPIKTLKNLGKSSRTSLDKSYVDSIKQLSKWKKKLSNDQIERILKVVDWFGFDFYNEELEPDYHAISKWTPRDNL
jgi:hypothetical protein